MLSLFFGNDGCLLFGPLIESSRSKCGKEPHQQCVPGKFGRLE